jgi:hypothetical protein
MAREKILAAADRAASLNVGTFCMVISGTRARRTRVREGVGCGARGESPSRNARVRLPWPSQRGSREAPRGGGRRSGQSQPQHLVTVPRRDRDDAHLRRPR